MSSHVAYDRVWVIDQIRDVVTTHTGLTLPVPPHVLATALLMDDYVFALSERAAAIACVDYVLTHIPKHRPELAAVALADPPVGFIREVTDALCAVA